MSWVRDLFSGTHRHSAASRALQVIQAWTKAVILLLPLLDTSEVEKTVLPFALEVCCPSIHRPVPPSHRLSWQNGEVSKSADQRLLCASLVGALASNLSVEAINGPSTSATSKSAPSLFKRCGPSRTRVLLHARHRAELTLWRGCSAMALCQDTDHNVRGCLALQLTKLAEAFNAKPGQSALGRRVRAVISWARSELRGCVGCGQGRRRRSGTMASWTR